MLNINDKNKVTSTLSNVLGNYSTLRGNELAFYCPFCNHHKQKLQLNDKSFKFHCWTCNAGGNLSYLGKKLGFSNTEIVELAKLTGADQKLKEALDKKGNWSDAIKELLLITEEEEQESHSSLLLPEEFKSALELKIDKKNPIEGHAIKYLKDRGITKKEIIRYNIGFCQKGLYAGRVIIPSYDSRNQLNYFIARSIFPEEKQKYKNPPVSKDVIVFSNQIDWNEPITLCEGVFDAIALKRNAIPLLGKFIQKKLDTELKDKKIETVYLCLDNDAQEDAMVLYDKIKSYVKSVKNIKLHEKDAGELSYENILKYQKNSVTLSWESVLKEKLSNLSASFLK